MELVTSGLLVHYETIFGPFCPKKVRFQTKDFSYTSNLDFWVQNQTIFGPFCPIQSYFGQSGKTDYFGTIWGQREETLLPVVILTFSQNYRLYNPSFTFSHHFFQFLWNTEFWVQNEFWVQKQTNFEPFFFEKSDFKQESKIFRLFGTTGKGPWFQSYFSTFQDVIDYVPVLSNSTVNKLKFLKGCN